MEQGEEIGGREGGREVMVAAAVREDFERERQRQRQRQRQRDRWSWNLILIKSADRLTTTY